MEPESNGSDPAVPAYRRVIRAFGPWNVAYVCGVPAVAATVPVFDALERASGTLGPDRLGGAVGSVILWAAGSFLFFGFNALRLIGWLVRRRLEQPGAQVWHAVIGCALPFAVLLASMAAVGTYDAVTSRPASVTRELAAPATIGGIAFAAGSVVEIEGAPPGRVVRGYAAAPTTIDGLAVVGDFELSFDASGFIRKGRLATAQPVDAVPCAPGVFHRDGDTVECTLAEPVVVNGATLVAGQQAGIAPGRDGAPARLAFGVLAEPADIGPLACAPGPVQSSDRWDGCVLARDQEVGGLWLMGGTNATLIHEEDGRTTVEGGAVLARPFEAFGVTLPRGTVVLRFPVLRPQDRRDGRLPPGAAIAFRTPEDAAVPVEGGEVHGRMDIELEGDRIQVSRPYRGSGTLLLDGRRVEGARLDRKADTWQVYSAGE